MPEVLYALIPVCHRPRLVSASLFVAPSSLDLSLVVAAQLSVRSLVPEERS